MMKEEIGRALVLIGLVLSVAGLFFLFGDRLPFRPGRLPGDFEWRLKNTTVYLPLGTCVLVSILLSIVLWLLNRR